MDPRIMPKLDVVTAWYGTLDGKTNIAIYSSCQKYRYVLQRQFVPNPRKTMIMIMLNPSTATEMVNDPTVERCERRARKNGYDALIVLNIFAYRATKPEDMKQQADPIGPVNNDFIKHILANRHKDDAVICGWGVHGAYLNRDCEVKEILNNAGIIPMAFEWTKAGHPKHPLYISYDKMPVVMHGDK